MAMCGAAVLSSPSTSSAWRAAYDEAVLLLLLLLV
jgi:hypothetical protein